jgi:hypothetical protein
MNLIFEAKPVTLMLTSGMSQNSKSEIDVNSTILNSNFRFQLLLPLTEHSVDQLADDEIQATTTRESNWLES